MRMASLSLDITCHFIKQRNQVCLVWPIFWKNTWKGNIAIPILQLIKFFLVSLFFIFLPFAQICQAHITNWFCLAFQKTDTHLNSADLLIYFTQGESTILLRFGTGQ